MVIYRRRIYLHMRGASNMRLLYMHIGGAFQNAPPICRYRKRILDAPRITTIREAWRSRRISYAPRMPKICASHKLFCSSALCH